MTTDFDPKELKKLFKPEKNSSGEDNGQLTIIGGSSLFHGAPILTLKIASRIVDMVFFASPEPTMESVSSYIKSELSSFIWTPWDDVDNYVEKSDAVLIGSGFMRFGSEKTPEELRNHENNDQGRVTREITRKLLSEFPNKKWVIDAGSLQVMDPDWIPENAILTPNTKEFELLFKCEANAENAEFVANKYNCIVVLKGPETIICSQVGTVSITGGNAGLTKGGTGDVLAGLTAALLTKNDPFLSACSASYVLKASADTLYKKRDVYYSADDLAESIPEELAFLTK